METRLLKGNTSSRASQSLKIDKYFKDFQRFRLGPARFPTISKDFKDFQRILRISKDFVSGLQDLKGPQDFKISQDF